MPIVTNGKTYGSETNERVETKALMALKELLEEGLVEEIGEGEYQVTEKGRSTAKGMAREA